MRLKQTKVLNLKYSPGYKILARINPVLQERGIKGYLVGGYIRDTLLGRDTADIDLAIRDLDLGFARELADSLTGKFVVLNEAYKVARIVLAEGDRMWHLDLSSLRGNIEEDLKERDFTIDSLAVTLEPGIEETEAANILDLYGGEKDLDAGLITAVSAEIFEKDPVRLLRAFRLGAELEFEIETETAQLVAENSRLIKQVAGERVRQELTLLLEAPETYSWLNYMDKLGLLMSIFPELATCRGVEQPKEHYWDVFNHSLETVRAVERLLNIAENRDTDPLLFSVPWSPETTRFFSHRVNGGTTRAALLKVAALLHDIAKPRTKSLDGDRWRFLGHAKDGASMTQEAMERLRFSRHEINIVKAEVNHHLRPGQLTQEDLPTTKAIYRYFRDVGEVAIDTLYLSLADHIATRGPNINTENWQANTRLVAHVLQDKARRDKTIPTQKLLDGHDIMNRFNIKAGPELGILLEEIREARASGEISTRDEALAFARIRLGLS